MFKKISFVMLIVSLSFLFACATPYVKDISDEAVATPVDEIIATPVIAPPEIIPATRDTAVTHTATIKDIVLFDFDSFKLNNLAKLILNKIAVEMENTPDTFIILRGHTDKVGSDEYNQLLSEDRVDAVEDYLYEAGVLEDQIFSVQAFGESMLLPDLTDHENRRVIILSIEIE